MGLRRKKDDDTSQWTTIPGTTRQASRQDCGTCAAERARYGRLPGYMNCCSDCNGSGTVLVPRDWYGK